MRTDKYLLFLLDPISKYKNIYYKIKNLRKQNGSILFKNSF